LQELKKELADQRQQIRQLQKEKDRLLAQMNAGGAARISTASSFSTRISLMTGHGGGMDCMLTLRITRPMSAVNFVATTVQPWAWTWTRQWSAQHERLRHLLVMSRQGSLVMAVSEQPAQPVSCGKRER